LVRGFFMIFMSFMVIFFIRFIQRFWIPAEISLTETQGSLGKKFNLALKLSVLSASARTT